MKNKKAFSLLELLIVIAIIAILSTLAYPAYNTYIRKAHRAQAKITLIDLAARLEQYYFLNNSYQASLNELNFQQNNLYYHFEITAQQNTFRIAAIPLNNQTKDPCGTLFYNQLNQKEISGNDAIENCW